MDFVVWIIFVAITLFFDVARSWWKRQQDEAVRRMEEARRSMAPPVTEPDRTRVASQRPSLIRLPESLLQEEEGVSEELSVEGVSFEAIQIEDERRRVPPILRVRPAPRALEVQAKVVQAPVIEKPVPIVPSVPAVHTRRRLVLNPETARQAMILSAVFGPPKGMR